MKIQKTKTNKQTKTLQEQGRENNNNILYILCQAVWRARKKKKNKENKKYKEVFKVA